MINLDYNNTILYFDDRNIDKVLVAILTEICSLTLYKITDGGGQEFLCVGWTRGCNMFKHQGGTYDNAKITIRLHGQDKCRPC